MLKLFFRLRRRHGIVLFAVIAIMSLLIAAAATAYITARNSYNTVVENYDYSQLYLSTTSVSDMLVEAITQDTSKQLDGASNVVNYYKSLKDAIKKLKDDVAGGSITPGTDSAKITICSENISSLNKVDAGAMNMDNVKLMASNNPIEPGIIDGVRAVISLDSADPYPVVSGTDTTYYFSIQTMGFYRGETVIVSDVLYNKTQNTSTPDTVSLFDTFFTASSQQRIGGANAHAHDRSVILDIDNISDNAYFYTDMTAFVPFGGRPNFFDGGFMTSGSAYFLNMMRTNHIKPPSGEERHDWIIGGDFVVKPNGESLLDLHGNTLYVGGNIILKESGTLIKNGTIYCMGDLICLNDQAGIQNCTVYLNKNNNGHGAPLTAANGTLASLDDKSKPTITTDSYGNKITTYPKIGTVVDNALKTIANTYTGEFNSDSNWYNNFKGNFTSNISNPNKVAGNGGTTVQAFDPEDLSKTVQISQKDLNNPTKKYKLSPEMPIKNVVNTESGPMKWTSFDNLTTEKAVENHVTIDFSAFNSESGLTRLKNGSGATIGFQKKFGDITVTFNGSTVNNRDSITVDVPYKKDGYSLEIKAGSNGPMVTTGSGGTTWYFHTKENDPSNSESEAMPIVLESNMTYNGERAFSWYGTAGNVTANSHMNAVLLCGDSQTDPAKGNVLFEMGNYDTSSNKYIMYDPAKAGQIQGVKYVADQKEFVGTVQQFNQVGGFSTNYKINMTDNNGVLKSDSKTLNQANSMPISGMENRVLIISNKEGGVGYDAYRDNNTVCGYVYMPNTKAQFGAQDQTNVVGGMIVSDYAVGKSNALYQEPDPDILADLLAGSKNMGSPTPGPVVSTNGIWVMSNEDTDYGKNYLG